MRLVMKTVVMKTTKVMKKMMTQAGATHELCVPHRGDDLAFFAVATVGALLLLQPDTQPAARTTTLRRVVLLVVIV